MTLSRPPRATPRHSTPLYATLRHARYSDLLWHPSGVISKAASCEPNQGRLISKQGIVPSALAQPNHTRVRLAFTLSSAAPTPIAREDYNYQ